MRPLLAWTPIVAALLLACSSARAQQPLDFADAQTRLHAHSDRLAAAQAEVEAKRLQAHALRGLGGPSLSVGANMARYQVEGELDITRWAQRIGEGLDEVLPGLPLDPATELPPLPSLGPLRRSGSLHSQSLTALWPVYTGGRNSAARELASARAEEARADADTVRSSLHTTLVQRYFGLQLARLAAELRTQALAATQAHDHAAQRMLEEGLIARVERLQAQVALEDARRQALKAQADADLAQVGLQRLLHLDTVLAPTTPLFIHTRPLQPLAHFQQQALARHPGLDKVAALRDQAEQLQRAGRARWKPTVAAFGQRQLGSHDNWLLGLRASWTLWSSLDRRALDSAAAASVAQADHSDAQARSDISLLVERNWHSVEDARQHYLAMAPALELAEELLRLRRIGLHEGSSTSLEVIEAQTHLAKVQTERAQAAHDWVQALAALLESAGIPEQFDDYARRADTRISP